MSYQTWLLTQNISDLKQATKLAGTAVLITNINFLILSLTLSLILSLILSLTLSRTLSLILFVPVTKVLVTNINEFIQIGNK